jgi:hypothetical protein
VKPVSDGINTNTYEGYYLEKEAVYDIAVDKLNVYQSLTLQRYLSENHAFAPLLALFFLHFSLFSTGKIGLVIAHFDPFRGSDVVGLNNPYLEL